MKRILTKKNIVLYLLSLLVSIGCAFLIVLVMNGKTTHENEVKALESYKSKVGDYYIITTGVDITIDSEQELQSLGDFTNETFLKMYNSRNSEEFKYNKLFLSPGIGMTNDYVKGEVPVSYLSETINEHLDWEISDGRSFNSEDYLYHRDVVILGHEYKKYFKVGDVIFLDYPIKNENVKIIGFFKKNSFFIPSLYFTEITNTNKAIVLKEDMLMPDTFYASEGGVMTECSNKDLCYDELNAFMQNELAKEKIPTYTVELYLNSAQTFRAGEDMIQTSEDPFKKSNIIKIGIYLVVIFILLLTLGISDLKFYKVCNILGYNQKRIIKSILAFNGVILSLSIIIGSIAIYITRGEIYIESIITVIGFYGILYIITVIISGYFIRKYNEGRFE